MCARAPNPKISGHAEKWIELRHCHRKGLHNNYPFLTVLETGKSKFKLST